MSRLNNSKGFALLELIAVAVIVGLIALAGVKVYGSHKNSVANEADNTAATDQAQIESSQSTVPQIKSSTDLDKASQTLDQNDPDSSNVNDSSQLDHDINDL
jgi:prepilin-type N-terminal cleavage/methylation domain-containing protein